MAKREKKQRPVKMNRKYQSRVEREQRQVRYIIIGTGIVVAVSVLVLLAGLYQIQIANPQATRRAKDALKDIPAVTVNGTPISIADWQVRVRYERQLMINQIDQIDLRVAQLSQQFDPNDEFGQQLLAQGQAQSKEIQNMLDSGIGVASDVLEQMIDEQLIRQEASRRGIVITPDELQKHIEVNFFAYPYPPTAEPYPTLPPPTLPPTATVMPEPTLTPIPSPTARTREEFEADYEGYTQGVKEIAGMSEEAWRAMFEGALYYEKLLVAFGAEVDTQVQQVKGSYSRAIDRETSEMILEQLNAGVPFETLVQEIQTGEFLDAMLDPEQTEEPTVRAGSFDWSPLGVVRDQFGQEFATVAFNTEAGRYVSEVIPASDGGFYLIYVQENKVRELPDYLVDQQIDDIFETWLSEQKAGEGIVYGDWSSYIPRELSIPQQ